MYKTLNIIINFNVKDVFKYIILLSLKGDLKS
jgi:hypothetical protein